MRKSSSLAALAAAVVLACGVVAWEWYTHVGGSGAPSPVQAVTAAPSPAPPNSPTPGPVTYVPIQPRVTLAPATAAPATSAPTATASPTPVAAVPKPAATRTPAAAAAPTVPPQLSAGKTPAPQEMPIEASTVAPAHIAAAPVVREPPDALPRIISMSLSTPVAHGGETVSGTVETTSNVASVTARIGGYATPMQKVGVGRFQMSYVVPHLPFFLHRTWTIEVIARNSRGDAVSSSLPITIR